MSSRYSLSGNNVTKRVSPVASRVIQTVTMGNPVSITWLIEQIVIPELARVAGETSGISASVTRSSRQVEKDQTALRLDESADAASG